LTHTFRRLSFAWVAAAWIAGSAVGRADEPPAPPRSDPAEPPIPIFLNTPADRDAFWKMLARPDFVILDGDLYRKLRQASELGRPGPAAPSPPATRGVEVTGTVVADRAALVIELVVSLDAKGAVWVPIQLDGLTLARVTEGSRDLAARATEGRSWQVELEGVGEHRIRVELLAPVRSTAEGSRLELAIPPAASTRVELTVPRTVLDATTGPGEPVGVSVLEGGAGAKLSTRLSPRPRLDLVWRERADPAVKLPVRLSAQGEIALEVERGLIRSRGSWVVAAVRGTTSRITVRLDPAEEVLDVEVDKRPVTVETRREGNQTVVAIPLNEPLRPNTTRTIDMNTRRPIASTGPVRVAIGGCPFDQASAQTGVLAIARNGPLFLNPTAGRGLRRIDPRTELPESLRARPDTVLAYEIFEQPFELSLGIDTAPPRIRVESRTTVTLDARIARIDTWLDCRNTQGRAFELPIEIPRGLTLESALPSEVVASAQLPPDDGKPGEPDRPADSSRLLLLGLTPQAREAGSFAIHLTGWAPLDPTKPVVVPLFQPRTEANLGGRVVVLSGRDIAVEPAEATREQAPMRVDWGKPPTFWAWPTAAPPGPEMATLWLRQDPGPASLPLRVTPRQRMIRHETSLTATVDRRGADVVEEIAGEVAFGTLGSVEVAVPADFPSRWELASAEVTERKPLGVGSDGSRRYRLQLAREVSDAFRLRFRYRLPMSSAGATSKLALAAIRMVEGISSGRTATLTAEPGLEIKAEGEGWTQAPASPAADASEPAAAAPLRLAQSPGREAPLVVEATVAEPLPMPALVASRLWIRTTQLPDESLSARAWYWVEVRGAAMTVGLPPGSRLVRARVGSREAGADVLQPVEPDVYRLKFPPGTPSGPVLVALEYAIPRESMASGWPAPRLLEGGVVQQTLWEARLLGTRAGVGVPSGWTDENEWYWDGLLFRRRPALSAAELARWVAGGGGRGRLPEPLDASETPGGHSYLFGRSGAPEALAFPVFSRFALLLICSGPVLLVGLLVLARRPPPRLVAGSILVLILAVGAVVEPHALILIAQCSVLGFALLAGAVLIHGWLERFGRAGRRGEGSSSTPVLMSGSSLSRGVATPGSDDSTAIRARPPSTPSAVSTADHIVLTRASTGIRGLVEPPPITDPRS
jgi:hypothetical protein